MFLKNVKKEKIDIYSKHIKSMASLSGLFSNSQIPFLHYRIAENIFCKSFKAENLSRADIAYDAKLESTGIGLKTFISKGNKREKIAEFNAHSDSLKKNNNDKELILELSDLRNTRIDFANRTYGIKKGIYHCVVREKNKINIFETDYNSIDKDSLKNIKREKASIFFEDNNTEYSFNFSKSTLYRRFYTPKDALSFDIKIVNDPYELILKLFNEYSPIEGRFKKESENVILPLYSTRNRNEEKIVPSKSGLNQWNAGGRKRDMGEVYIPVPRKIHKFFPGFFLPKDKTFKIILPSQDTDVLSAKMCQQGGKAIMTNPNDTLSYWLLRKVLKLKEKEILTYSHLKKLGIDSVKVTKIDTKVYKIDFSKIDMYEEFEEKYMGEY